MLTATWERLPEGFLFMQLQHAFMGSCNSLWCCVAPVATATCPDGCLLLPASIPALRVPSIAHIFAGVWCVWQASEAFLQRVVALCVASHYRNTPNDLLLMADAPAHRLFVLLGPVDDTVNALPDILAVVQVCKLAQPPGSSAYDCSKRLLLGACGSLLLSCWTP